MKIHFTEDTEPKSTITFSTGEGSIRRTRPKMIHVHSPVREKFVDGVFHVSCHLDNST